MEINIAQTHIRLTSDLKNHNLYDYILSLRADLKKHIAHNPEFLHSFRPVERKNDELPAVVERMYDSAFICDVGPMACVAGTVSQFSLDYLIGLGSKKSIVENGGDISLINDRTVLCGIYSGNEILGDDIAFKIKRRSSPIGICTSSGKIGHSISFGNADSVTVISDSASVADGLATRIANEAKGITGQDRVSNASECAENYREFFTGALIVSADSVATVGRLPKIVETSKFDVKKS